MTGSDEMQKKMLRAWGTEGGLCSVNRTMAPVLKYIHFQPKLRDGHSKWRVWATETLLASPP